MVKHRKLSPFKEASTGCPHNFFSNADNPTSGMQGFNAEADPGSTPHSR